TGSCVGWSRGQGGFHLRRPKRPKARTTSIRSATLSDNVFSFGRTWSKPFSPPARNQIPCWNAARAARRDWRESVKRLDPRRNACRWLVLIASYLFPPWTVRPGRSRSPRPVLSVFNHFPSVAVRALFRHGAIGLSVPVLLDSYVPR